MGCGGSVEAASTRQCTYNADVEEVGVFPVRPLPVSQETPLPCPLSRETDTISPSTSDISMEQCMVAWSFRMKVLRLLEEEATLTRGIDQIEMLDRFRFSTESTTCSKDSGSDTFDSGSPLLSTPVPLSHLIPAAAPESFVGGVSSLKLPSCNRAVEPAWVRWG